MRHMSYTTGGMVQAAKDREKEQPYILEVNATPGLGGIEEVTKDKSVTQEIMKIYMNRENWS